MDQTSTDIRREGAEPSAVGIELKVELADILDLLDGTRPVAEASTRYVCKGVTIAEDADGARRVACSYASHGVGGGPFAAMAQHLMRLRPGARKGGPCPICDDVGLLPIGSREAHSQFAMARAVGFFRGLTLPQVVETKRALMAAKRAERGAHGATTRDPVSTLSAHGGAGGAGERQGDGPGRGPLRERDLRMRREPARGRLPRDE